MPNKSGDTVILIYFDKCAGWYGYFEGGTNIVQDILNCNILCFILCSCYDVSKVLVRIST